MSLNFTRSPHLLDLRRKTDEPKTRKFSFNKFLKRLKKPFFIFLISIFCLVVVFIIYNSFREIPRLRQEIVVNSLIGLEKLKIGAKSLTQGDFDLANEGFNQADQDFQKSIRILNQANPLVRLAVKITPLGQSAYHLLKGGKSVADIGLILSQTVLDFNYLVSQSIEKIEDSSLSPTPKGQESALPLELVNLNFLDINSLFKKNLKEIHVLFREAKEDIAKTNLKFIPADYQIGVEQFFPSLQKIEENLENWLPLLEITEKILGKSSFQRYLFILQNNNEIRPSGGFIGTFARVDIDQGRIKAIEMPAGGAYDIQGQLLVKLKSPQPLWLVQPRWYFHDANWFADWPMSSQKLAWFYEKAGGPTVDGVIGLTADLIPEFLKITGPIEMPAYQKTLTAENFIFETQKAIEMEYNREENRPKQFLVDFTPLFLKKLLMSEKESFQFLEILEILIQALNKKQILLYFNDSGIEKFITEKNWAGQIKETSRDYLYLVQANVNGAKTTQVIEDQIFHQAEVQSDGSIIDTLTLIKKHNGQSGDLFTPLENTSSFKAELKQGSKLPGNDLKQSPSPLTGFTGKRTINYLKIYVPKGSIFLGATGFQRPAEKEFLLPEADLLVDNDLAKIEKEIDWDPISGTKITEEFGKTVFGNWIQVEPGESTQATIKYRLPFKFSERTSFFSGLFQPASSTYSLLIQQQPGQTKNLIESKLILPSRDYSIIWQYPEWLKTQDHLIKYSAVLDSDKYWAVVIKK